MRGMDDPLYDPCFLHIPPADINKLTPMMKHYWKVKSQHFDKLVFWAMGKFYELFFEDALVVNQYFDLAWMGNKMHVGIHCRTVDKYVSLLVSKGHKVVMVDQTETNE